MTTLRLPVRREYFEAMRDGSKVFEFRLVNAYWTKRLMASDIDTICITLGYPHRSDMSRHLFFPWRGFIPMVILHPHFGAAPVTVYAIPVIRHA